MCTEATNLDPDGTKFAGVVLGLFGIFLGVYNLYIAHGDRRQKAKNGYAITLLWLEPILEKLISLPFSSPEEFHKAIPSELAIKLEEIETLLDSSKEKLVNLVPEVAADILAFNNASRILRLKLQIPFSDTSKLMNEAVQFLEASWKLAMFRHYAPKVGMKLFDQVSPSVKNWSGDASLALLIERWELFSKTR